MAGHWSPLSSAHPNPWESRTVEILTVRIGNIREPGALKNTKTCRDRSEFIDTYRGRGVVFLLKVTLQIC